jgi:hypothetical protein
MIRTASTNRGASAAAAMYHEPEPGSRSLFSDVIDFITGKLIPQ